MIAILDNIKMILALIHNARRLFGKKRESLFYARRPDGFWYCGFDELFSSRWSQNLLHAKSLSREDSILFLKNPCHKCVRIYAASELELGLEG